MDTSVLTAAVTAAGRYIIRRARAGKYLTMRQLL